MLFDFLVKTKVIIDQVKWVYDVVDNFNYFTEIEKKSFINESFYNQIKYCRKFVPYYSKIFAEYSIHENQFTDIVKINQLPVLTKDMLRKNYDDLFSKNIKNLKYITRRSGGTTGEPIRANISKEAQAFETLTYFRGLKQMGWSPSMTTIRLFGGSMGVNKKINIRSQIYQLSTNTISINAFNIDDNVVRKHLAKIKSSKKVCIIGYPSAINNLADRFKSINIKLSNVKLALTTSEQLIEDWKINIKNVFGCTVKSFYGCGEVESIGYQTNEKTDSYDIAREHIIVDSVNNNELLFTQLFNKAQPLIRYKNGDLGLVNNDNSSSKISKLLGRSADYFFRSDGTRVSPVFGTHSILNAGIMVKKYQYVQHENNKIDF
jgi:phenylacetate-CoA ligase